MTINKNLTTINLWQGNNRKIEFIVIHYTANNGDTAKGNTDYFKSGYHASSAHYFVDETSIWQCVADEDIAWHCGGNRQGVNGGSFFNVCTNMNSIGIELCSRMNGETYYFKDKTIENAVELVKDLMRKYDISADHVIRHYDVTGKICPNPFVVNQQKWLDFKKMISSQKTIKLPDVYYQTYVDRQWTRRIKNVSGYSGTKYGIIRGLNVNTSSGDVLFQTHQLNGEWTPWVDNRNTLRRYLGVPIDAIRVKPEGNVPYKIVYRVATQGNNFMPWIVNDYGYAGTIGRPISRIQMKVEV